ncbi:hypothetical protein BDN70DRAFT_774583, partial [Pholiota conissans]
RTSPGYRKLLNFCRASSRDHGFMLGWMDILCINKESSAELCESIRSMYKCYASSQVCVVYLAQMEALSDMHSDPWFTRGWTLPELLAPATVKFYNRDWEPFLQKFENDKKCSQIREQIVTATSILFNIHNAPFSRRMQMAATREVTHEEDMAYSLNRIFDVSISTAYGEGAERAFFRLLQEILK